MTWLIYPLKFSNGIRELYPNIFRREKTCIYYCVRASFYPHVDMSVIPVWQFAPKSI